MSYADDPRWQKAMDTLITTKGTPQERLRWRTKAVMRMYDLEEAHRHIENDHPFLDDREPADE